MARSKYRSVAYDLEASIAVALTVERLGGDTAPADVAAQLGYSGTNNGAFLSRMASARAFGLVSGRSGRIRLTERGRAVLGNDSAAAAARGDAFRAVPLYRAVLEELGEEPLPQRSALVDLLVERFGESRRKAPAVAGRLSASAAQVRIGNYGTSNFMLPVVRSPWKTARDGGMTVRDDGEQSLFLEETGSAGPRRRKAADHWRRTGVVAAAVACLAVVGVPVGLVFTSSTEQAAVPPAPVHHPRGVADLHLPTGPAEREVISALSATTSAGNFRFSYHLSSTEPASSTSSAYSSALYRTIVNGSGTIDTDPTAMLASTSIGPSVRVDGTDYWEGSSGAGLVPAQTTGGLGRPLETFSGLVESTLGERAGAVAMMAMASPTGFLDLGQTEVTGAQASGTTTIGGIAMTDYQVSLDPTSLATEPGTTADETEAISAALQVLVAHGLSGITADLSVDATGYIERATTVTTFTDGGTVTLQTTLSDFGCAGTVIMPGQQGAATAPAGCVSPDTGQPAG